MCDLCPPLPSQSLKNKLERSQQVSEALWQNIVSLIEECVMKIAMYQESFIEGHLTLSPDEGGSDNRTSKSKVTPNPVQSQVAI